MRRTTNNPNPKWFIEPQHPMTGAPHDTWGLEHEGQYYLFFLARGPFIGDETTSNHNNVSLITSNDGVHWREHGPVFRKYPDSSLFGSGHIWRSPNFENDGLFIMNYGQHFPEMKSDTILFATSKDLLNWTLLGRGAHELKPDGKHHPIENRFHGVSVLPREQGGYYGYWSGLPTNSLEGGVSCMGYTTDGIHFTQMPAPLYEPLNGEGSRLRGGDFSDIEKIGDTHYAIWWNGYANRTWTAPTPNGLFKPAARNHLLIGGLRTAIFLRFFRTSSDLLVSHASFTAAWKPKLSKPICPLKRIVIDPKDGAMFLGWWPGNDAGKEEQLRLEKAMDGNGLTITAADGNAVDLSRPVLLEADVTLPDKPGEYCGIRFQCKSVDDPLSRSFCHCPRWGLAPSDVDDTSSGSFTLRLYNQGRAALVFDEDERTVHHVDRRIEYPRANKLRVFMIPGLIEVYLGDYLIDSFQLASRQFPHHTDAREWLKQNEGTEKIRIFQLTSQLAPVQKGDSGRVENMKVWH